MSFKIKLQRSLSDKNQMSKNIELIGELEGDLRSETSIVDPVIVFNGNMDDFRNANYMTIDEFGRYYFITEIKSIRKDVFEVHAHCDVLCSFWDGILSNEAIIDRAESSNVYNKRLDDGSFKVYANPLVKTIEFPNGFAQQEFILIVAGA